MPFAPINMPIADHGTHKMALATKVNAIAALMSGDRQARTAAAEWPAIAATPATIAALRLVRYRRAAIARPQPVDRSSRAGFASSRRVSQ